MQNHLTDQKNIFITLLLEVRKQLHDKNRINAWNKVIKHFMNMSPEKLEEKFLHNNLYTIEKIIEPELDCFKISNLISHYSPSHRLLSDIDRMLTDQMSSILPKVFVAVQLSSNPRLDIKAVHRFIVERNMKSCLLHDLIKI